MFKLINRKFSRPLITATRNYQVTVVGGASDVGQTVSLLLRNEPRVSRLVVHDNRAQTTGVVLDLSHVPAESHLIGHTGEDTLAKALKESHIVIGAGGLIRKPGISEKLWLTTNTAFIKALAHKVSKMNPLPFFGIVTEPLNNIVPMAAEVMRHHGDYDPRKVFGITGVDAWRAQTLYANQIKLNPRNCALPVIGGHSELTAIPLLSQSIPTCDFDYKTCLDFTRRFRGIEDLVISTKKGYSPVLSIAYSVLSFTRSVIDAIEGQPAEVHALIENNDFGTSYFAGPVHINETGVKEMQRFTTLTQYECQLLEQCLNQLRKDVLKGKKVLELET